MLYASLSFLLKKMHSIPLFPSLGWWRNQTWQHGKSPIRIFPAIINLHLPCGKPLHNYGKSPCENSLFRLGHFLCRKLLVISRGYIPLNHQKIPLNPNKITIKSRHYQRVVWGFPRRPRSVSPVTSQALSPLGTAKARPLGARTIFIQDSGRQLSRQTWAFHEEKLGFNMISPGRLRI